MAKAKMSKAGMKRDAKNGAGKVAAIVRGRGKGAKGRKGKGGSGGR